MTVEQKMAFARTIIKSVRETNVETVPSADVSIRLLKMYGLVLADLFEAALDGDEARVKQIHADIDIRIAMAVS